MGLLCKEDWDALYVSQGIKVPWSYEDQTAAVAEGWALSIFDGRDTLINNGGHLISSFNTNEEAVEFVKAKANEGSNLHRRAIEIHIAAFLIGSE